MPFMPERYHGVTQYQRNQLFGVMRDELGYSETHLLHCSWKNVPKPNNIIASRLTCRIREYEHFFEFKGVSDEKWNLTFSTKLPSVSNTAVANSWSKVIDLFRPWAKNLFDEIKDGDLWQQLSPIPLITISREDVAEAVFSPHERRNITTEINHLAQQIKNRFPLRSVQIDFVDKVFEVLKNGLNNFSRPQWLDIFIGAMASVALQLTVSWANNDPFWQMVAQTFNNITMPLLPAGR